MEQACEAQPDIAAQLFNSRVIEAQEIAR
jgi:hypothetical protein